MIFYYALGGGLGHLTRGRRVLETLGIEASFVTASSYADDVRVTGPFPVIRVPVELEGNVDAHHEWLRGLDCDRLIVDTFPCGIQGELSGLDVPMDLVARRLKWDAYRRAVPHALPKFERVWKVEELEPAQQTALHSEFWSAVAWPPLSKAAATAAALQTFSLIVHSGPEDEVRELVAYAQELTNERVLVATRCSIDLPENFERIDAFPVTHLLAHATCIISAAGFNIMLETEPWRDKHHPVPFARQFDDQYHRAALRRTS